MPSSGQKKELARRTGEVDYLANDGVNVHLSPSIVLKNIVSGSKEVPEKELYKFIAICQARKLNPLAGDAYMVCYKNKYGGVDSSVIVSKDYFMRTASNHDGYDGMVAGVVVKTNEGLSYRQGCIVLSDEELVGGWAEVYDKERSHSSRSEVSLLEYKQNKGLWLTKPATMIRKVAIVQALREAYPGSYGGIYDSDEIQEAEQPEPVSVSATYEEEDDESF